MMVITHASLRGFAGRWEGSGHAKYPTIAPVDYFDEMVFEENGHDPVLHYVQRNWKAPGGVRTSEPLFWESGFLIDRGEGVFELVSAQRSGRVEVLRGPATMTDNGVILLNLSSVTIANDPRTTASSRRWEFAPQSFRYVLSMSTTAHPPMAVHASATLQRAD